MRDCLHWLKYTSVDFASFCLKVTIDWLKNQQNIGDDGVVEGIDETFCETIIRMGP